MRSFSVCPTQATPACQLNGSDECRQLQSSEGSEKNTAAWRLCSSAARRLSGSAGQRLNGSAALRGMAARCLSGSARWRLVSSSAAAQRWLGGGLADMAILRLLYIHMVGHSIFFETITLFVNFIFDFRLFLSFTYSIIPKYNKCKHALQRAFSNFCLTHYEHL